jgi:DegV family protein with EDD domain
VITDSVSDLPQRVAEEHGITVIPVMVHFGLEQYRDRVEMSIREFMRRLPLAKTPPKTSQPAPGDFLQAYQEATADGSSVVSVHPSSRLSGTYQSAVIARSMLEDRDIEVVDTRLASMGQGWVALRAAREAMLGRSKQEVMSAVTRVASSVKTLIVVDTLEYLARNGRIGKAQAWLGTMLKVKPILTLDDGLIAPLEKAVGAARALGRLVDMVRENIELGKRVVLGIVHADAAAQAQRLKEELERLFDIEEVIITETGPAIAANVGPGTYGVMLYQD